MLEYVKKKRNKENKLLVIHADNREFADEVVKALEEELGEKVDMIAEMGAVIGTHAGPGTVAVSC